MKIDLTKTLLNLDGIELKDGDKVATVGHVITQSLLGVVEGDEKMEGLKKAELFNLWFDKVKDKKEADLKPEEKVLVKDRIGKMYHIIVVGQMFKILDK